MSVSTHVATQDTQRLKTSQISGIPCKVPRLLPLWHSGSLDGLDNDTPYNCQHGLSCSMPDCSQRAANGIPAVPQTLSLGSCMDRMHISTNMQTSRFMDSFFSAFVRQLNHPINN
ncbi:uncharacterized protein LOC144604656 [Rhinoraja longicauda]